MLTEIAVGPAIEGAISHAGHIVRHQLIAQPVPLIYGDPECLGARRPTHSDWISHSTGECAFTTTVGIYFENVRAAVLVFHAVLGEITARSHRDIDLLLIAARNNVS